MTEPQKRLVSGLAPRPAHPVTGDLSRLQAKNRGTAAPTPVAPPSSDSKAALNSRSTGKESKRITVYIEQSVFARARGVFRATSHLEDDKSWSQFVEKALLREAEAREHAHNEGARYDDSAAQLSSGRPLAD